MRPPYMGKPPSSFQVISANPQSCQAKNLTALYRDNRLTQTALSGEAALCNPGYEGNCSVVPNDFDGLISGYPPYSGHTVGGTPTNCTAHLSDGKHSSNEMVSCEVNFWKTHLCKLRATIYRSGGTPLSDSYQGQHVDFVKTGSL